MVFFFSLSLLFFCYNLLVVLILVSVMFKCCLPIGLLLFFVVFCSCLPIDLLLFSVMFSCFLPIVLLCFLSAVVVVY